MGHRNIQFHPPLIDFQADQGQSHRHPEPCIVYTNVPSYPQQNINFHPPIPEGHENAMFYPVPPYNNTPPQHNLDLNVAPPSGRHNPYLITPPSGFRDFPVQVNHHHRAHNIFYVNGVRGPFKRKNAEGTSSDCPYQNASVGPMSSPIETDIAQTDPAAMVECGSLRSVRNRAGMVGPDSVPAHNANVNQGNYVGPPVQLPGNPWLDMNFGANNGDMGTLAWGQPPNLPYVHANMNGARVEAANIGVQGYQVAAINRGAGFVHPNPIAQGRPNPQHPTPPMQVVRGFNVSHPPQIATSSRGNPMIRYSSSSHDPFQDVVDPVPAFRAPVLPTGFQLYRPQNRGEVLLDQNARHRNLPHLRVLPEDEVAMLEIPGYHVARESIDQHREMRLDIDHMSYEELLALGEQIGSVGTGLSEEFIQNNLKERTFTLAPASINLEVAACPDQETINFCVVCQTDYEYKESIGTLDCGHEYHKDCIKKWLLMKNSCPVCKSTALRSKGKDLAIDGH